MFGLLTFSHLPLPLSNQDPDPEISTEHWLLLPVDILSVWYHVNDLGLSFHNNYSYPFVYALLSTEIKESILEILVYVISGSF